jgi:hypothetical protein
MWWWLVSPVTMKKNILRRLRWFSSMRIRAAELEGIIYLALKA